ncbi:hypothetical protein K2173_010562 [Erythroxylum novogranatense]|uniref:Uncharacterized protein n=1 Tax=Erythroxylum novogranatense TaxID=1862640 RepID=A0AAV8TE47_9ROSI|nr:hypothetical protein K2173_010562 [Erythroxylum novogranatense]
MTKHGPLTAVTRAFTRAFTRAYSSFPLKHVTKSNFDSTFADLRAHVRAADFVAIDLEMTGVTSAPWRESFEFDRSDIRYLKVKDSAEKFAVVQFGVCPFRWDHHRDAFISHPHNFFIFPRQELESGASYEFLCQTTSMDFLSKYQFDFNTCINEGISYLSRAQERDALRRLNSRHGDGVLELKEAKDVPLVSIVDVLFSERMKNKLSEWRDGLLREGLGVSQSYGSLNESRGQFQIVFYKMRPALCLSGFTSHQLKLIQLVTRKYFRDLIYVRNEAENPHSKPLVVYADSEDDTDSLRKEVKDDSYRQAEKRIMAAIGFRQVIDLLSTEQKLLVGHNCFLDIGHIYSKFLYPLPSTAEEFAFSVNKYFPYIVDTKIVLNANQVLKMKKSSTSLSSAFSLLCPHIALGSRKCTNAALQSFVNVEIEINEMRSSEWSTGVKHEAGYDAFMTGCVFAQACSNLGIDFKLHSTSKSLIQNEKLQKHINLLYLSWSSGDIINLRSGNRSAESSLLQQKQKSVYENFVLIWGLPSILRRRDIKQCLVKVFGLTSVVSIYRVDETAVFVQFSKAEFVSKFLDLKESLERSNDPISVLHPLSKLWEGGHTFAAGYETYKEICSSPISKVLFAEQAEAIGIRWKTKLIELGVEDTVFDKESKTKASVCAAESKTGKKQHETDDSRSLCYNVINDFHDTEVKQVRASNL